MHEHDFLVAFIFAIIKNYFSALCPDKAFDKEVFSQYTSNLPDITLPL